LSNPESFIDEVTDEVRRERLFGYLRRYGWIGILAVLAIVAAAAWMEWRKAQDNARAQAWGDAVMTALDAPDASAREAALAGIVAEGDQKALTQLLAAGEILADPAADPAARARILEGLQAVAVDPAVSPVWQDLALLRWLTAPGAGIEPAQRRAGLESLAQPGRAFRPLAMEQIALERVAAGEVAAALADYKAILDAGDTPSALRTRAGQMIVVLGGDPSAQQ